jgi:hypothetical protein
MASSRESRQMRGVKLRVSFTRGRVDPGPGVDQMKLAVVRRLDPVDRRELRALLHRGPVFGHRRFIQRGARLEGAGADQAGDVNEFRLGLGGAVKHGCRPSKAQRVITPLS